MRITRRLERLAAVFALAASASLGGLVYQQARINESAPAALNGVASVTFGVAGLVELARLRRHPHYPRRS